MKKSIPKNKFNFLKTFLYFSSILIISCTSKEKLNDPLQAGWKGKKVCEVLEENEKIRTLKCTFPPGVGHEKHYHNTHVGYTIKGSKFKITDKNGVREVQIPTGYNFYNEKVEWHIAENIGDSTAIFLIVEPK